MVNKSILVGHIISEIFVAHMPNGAKRVEFRMVTENRFLNSSGEKKIEEDTHWIRAWGKMADIIDRYGDKGMLIYVEGKSRFEEWVSKSTGQHKTRTIVVADEFRFLEPFGEDKEDQQSDT